MSESHPFCGVANAPVDDQRYVDGSEQLPLFPDAVGIAVGPATAEQGERRLPQALSQPVCEAVVASIAEGRTYLRFLAAVASARTTLAGLHQVVREAEKVAAREHRALKFSKAPCAPGPRAIREHCLCRW